MGRGQGGARDRASGFASGPHAGAGCAEPVRIAMARHGAGMLGWLPQSPFARRSIGCGSRLHRTRLALLIEILIVLVLIVINGLFAMSELAVVSARPARLKLMAERGNAGARRALDLASDSGRFLSSVQIGITLVGVLSGAFSGATLGVRLAGALAGLGVAPIAAQSIGVGGVVLVITYLSLIVGELVPKQIALRSPEAVAARVAGPMHAVSRAAAPLVWILDRSGRLVLRLLGQAPRRERGPSDEEIRLMIREARDLGAMAAQESEMIASVMRLADRNARGLMTPRSDVDLVDLAEPAGKLLEQMRTSRRSRLPVRDGGEDAITGVVRVRDVLAAGFDPARGDLRDFVLPAQIVQDSMPALDVIERLRGAVPHMLLVFDEYGHFEGLITPMDILSGIAGEFEDSQAEPKMTRRRDGSWLVAGWMPVDEFADAFSLQLPGTRDYETVAGLALSAFGHFPAVGDEVTIEGVRIEVVDLDGRRIDKLLVQRAG